MTKRIKLLSLLLIVVLVFTGCASKGGSEDVSKEPGGEETPKLNFPTKPIELIVPYAAGGGNHVAAECLTPDAKKYLGQPLQVTCKPGAAGVVGNTYVAQSKADGYTLLYGSLALPVSLYTTEDLEYERDDFICIAMVSEVSPVLAVSADAPYNNAKELIEWAKANPNKFQWASTGTGSALHLAGANAMDEMGIVDITADIPFDGTAEGIAAVLGNHVQGIMCYAGSLTEQIKAGTMKVIGISADDRIAEYPDFVTFKEQGFDVTLASNRGIWASSDTPQEIIDYLNEAFGKLVADEAYKERFKAIGEPYFYADAEEATARYIQQSKTIENIINKLGLSN